MRPMEVSDAPTVADWYQQIEDISIFDRQVPVPINLAEVTRLIESIVADREKEKSLWFMVESDSGEVVGMTGLDALNLLHGSAILPVFVAKPWRGSGIGIRMVCMILDLAFKQMRLHRVATVFRADNEASRVIAERCGFTQEGVSRQAWFNQGIYFDLVNVGILADEWQKTRLELAAALDSAVTLELGPRPTNTWIWPSAGGPASK
jgi:RimJ/RimL family protein N-acetyltransferase